jgi:hypothetical protein
MMKVARVHLPSELEITIAPGPDGIQGKAVLRAHSWISVPQSQLDLKILPTSGDVHFDKETRSYRIELSLAALIQKPQRVEPVIIMP